VSKYGLSRIAKLLADLMTIKMIATFRENPLAMFGVGALASTAIAMIFLAAWLASFVRQAGPLDAAPMTAYVFPGSALLCVALAVFLVMLGLIAEEALQKVRAEEQVEGLELARTRG
jgi:hypothetical protein